MKAYYALPRFRPGAPFRPWLLRIVANEAHNRVRSSRRREGLALRAAAADPGGAAPSPEAAALEREDAEALVRAMERLREPDRLVIAYRYLFELSEAEMADALGVRPGTVKSRLSRALGRLRSELEASGEVTTMTERLRGLDDEGARSRAHRDRPTRSNGRRLPTCPAGSRRPSETSSASRRSRDRACRSPVGDAPLLLVVVGVVLLALAAVAAKVVIDLGALTIDTIPGRPTALPSAVASGPTLGHPATLPDAEREAGFTARVPDALGAPDAVWVDETPDGTRIVLGWKPRVTLPAIGHLPWGAVLYEFHGDAALASKLLFTDASTIQQVEVERTRRVVDHRPARARPGDGRRHLRPLPRHGQRAGVEERRCRHAPGDDARSGRGDPGRRERPRLIGGDAHGGNLVRDGGVEASEQVPADERSPSMRSNAIRIGIIGAVACVSLWGGMRHRGGGRRVSHPAPTAGRGDSRGPDGPVLRRDRALREAGNGGHVDEPRPRDAHGGGRRATSWGDPGISLLQGDTVRYRFDEDGVYPYSCLLHPGMVGAIVVGDGVGTATAGVVPVAASEDGTAASTSIDPAPVVEDGAINVILVWIAGAALLVAGLCGAFAIAERNRRKGAVAG